MSGLDPRLVAAVKEFEGFAPVAVWDYSQWSNGYGTKAHFPHEPITKPVAEQRLEVELEAAQSSVERFHSPMPLGVSMALTDLTYNAGPGWQHEGLGGAVKDNDWDTAKAHLLQYDRAGGRVNSGLEHRRQVEASWFAIQS